MMATDIRKQSPETIDDLKRMNYTVVTFEDLERSVNFYELIEEERR